MDRKSYLESVKSAAEKTVADTVIKLVLARVPFLAVGILNPITAFLIKKLVSLIIRETEMGTFFLYTDFRVSEEGKRFIEDANKYEQIKKTGTKDEIENQEAVVISSFRAFARVM